MDNSDYEFVLRHMPLSFKEQILEISAAMPKRARNKFRVNMLNDLIPLAVEIAEKTAKGICKFAGAYPWTTVFAGIGCAVGALLDVVLVFTVPFPLSLLYGSTIAPLGGYGVIYGLLAGAGYGFMIDFLPRLQSILRKNLA
jgi:hypothetical protein